MPRTRLATVVDSLHIRLDSASGVEAGTVLELPQPLADDAVVGDPIKVESIDRQANSTITLRAPGLSVAQQSAQTTAIGAGTRLGRRSREFRITVILLHQPDPARPSRNELITDSEMFRYLSLIRVTAATRRASSATSTARSASSTNGPKARALCPHPRRRAPRRTCASRP